MNEAELNRNVEELKEASARSTCPCLAAKYVALTDARVIALLLKKVSDGYVFKGITCLDRLGLPEQRSVYFDFDCQPDTFCLIKPAFMVIVDISDGYVVAITDPYTGSSSPNASSVSVTGISAIHLGNLAPVQLADGTLSLGNGGGLIPLGSDGTLPLRGDGSLRQPGDGTLPLRGDGTLPLRGDGTLPLRGPGFILVPFGWRFGNG